MIESTLRSKSAQSFPSSMKMERPSLGVTRVVDQKLHLTRSLMVEEETIIRTTAGAIEGDVVVMEVIVAAIKITTVAMMVTDTTVVEAIKAKLGRVAITTMRISIKRTTLIVLEQATTISEERSTRSDLIDLVSIVIL